MKKKHRLNNPLPPFWSDIRWWGAEKPATPIKLAHKSNHKCCRQWTAHEPYTHCPVNCIWSCCWWANRIFEKLIDRLHKKLFNTHPKRRHNIARNVQSSSYKQLILSTGSDSSGHQYQRWNGAVLTHLKFVESHHFVRLKDKTLKVPGRK